MLLDWKNSNHLPIDKLVGTVFDASIIRRQHILQLLGWSGIKFMRTLNETNPEGESLFFRKRIAERGEYVYGLTRAGVKKAHALGNIDTKIITFESQIAHQLGVNDILFRYLDKHDWNTEGLKWYSTREATDELFNFRSMIGQSDNEIRGNYIRPDGLIMLPNDDIFWIEYDNATESSRQIRKKYTLYIQNLTAIDEVTYGEMRRVVWIAPNAERTRWLETRWQEVKEKRNHANVEMLFYTAGLEDCF